MIEMFEGSPQEKLDRVAEVFADLAPQATCRLSRDGRGIVCQARCPDGTLHTETLSLEHLAAELAWHAAMRLGKATHPPESIGEWESWACAWHMIQVHATSAIAHVDDRIVQLEEDGSAAGVEVFQDLRRRVAVPQAKPSAWAGRA